jgi:chemotaxis protein MotB
MARRVKPPEPENHERWLVSYADFITLLFAFFVVMFASSQVDKGKQQQVADSVKRALDDGQLASAISGILGGAADTKGQGNAMMRGPGGSQKTKDGPTAPSDPPKPATLAELAPAARELSERLKEDIRSGKLQIQLTNRGLVVSLRQAAFFPSGDDQVDPKVYESIGKIAEVVKPFPNPIRLEGHTDSVPISTARFKSNWELSAARAISMMELLTTRFSIGSANVAIAGYADTIPVGDNATDEGRALNRRVDVVLLAQSGMEREPSAKPSPAPKPPPH